VLPNGLAPPPARRLVFVGLPVERPQFASSFEVVAMGTADGSIQLPDEATSRLQASELAR
jgi:hypothetical protein